MLQSDFRALPCREAMEIAPAKVVLEEVATSAAVDRVLSMVRMLVAVADQASRPEERP